tara:strand:+ start:1833 stop:2105 length:273 start_codon:yes stop_codon:yes gene_type:complete
MTFQVIEERLPVYWSSFLINKDASGLDPKEIHEVEDTIQYLKDHYETNLWCVDMKEDIHFELPPIYMNWLLAGDYATYVFHTEGLKNGQI